MLEIKNSLDQGVCLRLRQNLLRQRAEFFGDVIVRCRERGTLWGQSASA